MATTIANKLIPADILAFDNVDFVRVTRQIQVTKHPVEFGADVSDNARKEPVNIQLRGRITETPLLIPAPGAVELALGFFERNEGQLVTISTSRGVFPDMMITGYPWEIAGKKEIVFDVSAEQIRIASAVSVPIPARLPAPAVADGAASTANAGTQPPLVPPPPPTSLLGALASFL